MVVPGARHLPKCLAPRVIGGYHAKSKGQWDFDRLRDSRQRAAPRMDSIRMVSQEPIQLPVCRAVLGTLSRPDLGSPEQRRVRHCHRGRREQSASRQPLWRTVSTTCTRNTPPGSFITSCPTQNGRSMRIATLQMNSRPVSKETLDPAHCGPLCFPSAKTLCSGSSQASLAGRDSGLGRVLKVPGTCRLPSTRINLE